MAIRLGSAYGKVELDASGVVRGVNTAKTSLKDLAALGPMVGDAMQKMGAAMTLAVTVPLTIIGKKSLEYASGLQQSKDNVEVVFGEMSDAIITWSETSAKAFGQSQEDALDSVIAFDKLLESYDIGQQKAADMSMKLVTLSSDLAIFNKISASDAQQKLLDGLQGNTGALKDFGIALSDAEIMAKALQLGLVSASVDMVKVNGATLDLKQAQQELADVQNGGAGAADKLADAQSKVANATDRVHEANLKVERAQKDLNDLLADSDATNKQIERARRKLEDAENDYRKALENRTDAQRKANDVAKDSLPTDLGLAQAKQDVAEAEQKLNDALGGRIGKLDDATKAEVIYQLVIEKTADIQGTFSDRTETLAVQMMVLKAELKNTAAQLGEILLPIALDIVQALNDMLEKFQALPKGIQTAIVYLGIFLGLAGPLMTFVGTIIKLKILFGDLALILRGLGIAIPTLSGLFTTLSTTITTTVIPAISAMGTAIWTALAPLLPIIIAIIALVAGLAFVIWAFATDWMGVTTTLKQLFYIIGWSFKQMWEDLKAKTKAGLDWIETNWEKSTDVWKDNFEQAQEIMQKVQEIATEAMTKKIVDFVTKANAKITELRNWAINAWNQITGAFTRAWTTISNFFQSVKNSIISGIQAIISAVNDLIEALTGIELPDNLTPGSPTPFETGLRGIAAAMDQLSRQSIPELNRSFAMAQAARSPAYAMANSGMGGNIATQNLYFSNGLTERRAVEMIDGRIEQAFERMFQMLGGA